MARIRRWKESMFLILTTLFLPMVRSWARQPEIDMHHPVYSRLLARQYDKLIMGYELTANRPYVRRLRIATMPIAIPETIGAYLAGSTTSMALATSTSATSGKCSNCNTGTARCCSLTTATCCDPNCNQTACYTISCLTYNYAPTGQYVACYTCGFGTCSCGC
jgi:hypothetical protein